MERWLEYLEALDDGNTLMVWLLVLMGLLIGCISWVMIKRGLVFSMSKQTSNIQRNSLLSSIHELREHWSSQRQYFDVLRHGPERSGKFAGWFEDETKICRQFGDQIDALALKDTARYPAVELEYLKIVDELGARPKPLWVLLIIVVMMVAEAYGLSILLAGYLNDTGTASQDNVLALFLSVLFSVVLLFLAVHIGAQAYKQRYARRVWKQSENQQIKREIHSFDGKSVVINQSLGLSAEDNKADGRQGQPTRMANRSKYVADIMAETIGGKKGNNVEAYTSGFKIYVAAMTLLGILILVFRISAISDNFGKELVRAQQVASADTSTSVTASGRPKIVEQANDTAGQSITQESLERTKSTKIIGTLFYVLLFWLVQTLAVLLSSWYGFASDNGLAAYEKIRTFRQAHGAGALEEEYSERMFRDTERARSEARALASETLQNWQLGLQSEYRSGHAGLNEDQRNLIDSTLNSAASRNFDAYVEIMKPKPGSINSTKVSSGVEIGIKAPSDLPEANPVHTATDVDPKIDYIVINGGQTTSSEIVHLSELKARIGEAEIDPGSVSLRQAGSSDPHVSYRDFMKQLKIGRV